MLGKRKGVYGISNIVGFAFWNVHRVQKNIDRIINLGISEDFSVIAVCEAPSNMELMANSGYHLVEHIDNRAKQGDIQVFVKDTAVSTQYYYKEDSRFCLLRIEPIGINLVVVHLTSRSDPNYCEGQRADISRALSAIARMEEKYNDKRTIVIGDYNMNPYDAPMLEFTGFNAKLFRHQMRNASRTLHEDRHDLFYNPMMLVYHDAKSENQPRGTFFYHQVAPQWFCFDQVLIKHSLLSCFCPDSLQIVNKIGNEELTKGCRPKKVISDHLPISFEIVNKGGKTDV